MSKKVSPIDELLYAIEELGGTVTRSELLSLLSNLSLAITRRKAKKQDEE